MRFWVFWLLLCASTAWSSEGSRYSKAFRDFREKYHKVYANADEAQRREEIFAQNLAKIIRHNQEGHSWKLEVNEYADLTWEEFSGPRLMKNEMSIPASWQGMMQSADVPENQGNCGSCWAFATLSVMESAAAISLGRHYDLSEQELLDCDDGNWACDGGFLDRAMSYAQRGVSSEACYPYEGRAESCRKSLCDAKVRVSSFREVARNNEVALKAAVAMQPIVVAIQADKDEFQFYASGVMDSPDCGTALNHTVVIVGYGVEDTKPYWLVKNEWGSDWGDAGYIKIGRNTNRGSAGICGIAKEPLSVVVEAMD
jgi:hypothetical protein